MATQSHQAKSGDDDASAANDTSASLTSGQSQNPAIDPIEAIQAEVAQMPLEAKDSDLIEKEWVEKAKQIVASMSDDPFKQQQELSKLKADYLKKRYSKEVNLTDE